MSRKAASEVMEVMIENPAVLRVEPYYHWQLVSDDEEDDKFVDCAVAGRADYLVTYDKHFNVLKEIDFPHVPVITPAEFKLLLSDT